jgi:tetratricopeptide (TPR) repeat protein
VFNILKAHKNLSTYQYKITKMQKVYQIKSNQIQPIEEVLLPSPRYCGLVKKFESMPRTDKNLKILESDINALQPDDWPLHYIKFYNNFYEQIGNSVKESFIGLNADGNDKNLAINGYEDDYWYSVGDSYSLLLAIRKSLFEDTNIVVNQDEAYAAHRENIHQIFLSDPYYGEFGAFVNQLEDDVYFIATGKKRENGEDIETSAKPWTKMPTTIIIPILTGTKYAPHWRSIKVNIDYTNKTYEILFDDPYGMGHFPKTLKSEIIESLKTNIKLLIETQNNEKDIALSEPKNQEKYEKQQNNGHDCGPITFSNIQDYVKATKSNELVKYTIPEVHKSNHDNFIKKTKAADIKTYSEISGVSIEREMIKDLLERSSGSTEEKSKSKPLEGMEPTDTNKKINADINNKALNHNKNDVSLCYFNYGNELYGLGKKAEAIKYYEKVLEIDPNYGEKIWQNIKPVVIERKVEEMTKSFSKISTSDYHSSSSDEEYSDIMDSMIGSAEEVTDISPPQNQGCVVPHFHGYAFYKEYFTHEERREYGTSKKHIGKHLHSKASYANANIASNKVVSYKQDDELINLDKIIGSAISSLSENEFNEATKAYVNTYSSKPQKFLQLIEKCLIKEDLKNLDKSPVVSTSKTPEHAFRFSIAHLEKDKTKVIEPKYNQEGIPKHRLVGVMFVTLHKLSGYDKEFKQDITWVTQSQTKTVQASPKETGIHAHYRSQLEVLFFGGITEGPIIAAIPIVFPNLSDEHLSKAKGSTFYKKIFKAFDNKSGPNHYKKSATSNDNYDKKYGGIIKKMEAAYTEIAMRIAHKQAQKIGSDLVYIDSKGEVKNYKKNESPWFDIKEQIDLDNKCTKNMGEITSNFARYINHKEDLNIACGSNNNILEIAIKSGAKLVVQLISERLKNSLDWKQVLDEEIYHVLKSNTSQEMINIIQKQLNPELQEFIKNYDLGNEHDLENDLFNFGINIGNDQIKLMLNTNGMQELLNNNFIYVNDLKKIYNFVNQHQDDLATIMRHYVKIFNHNDANPTKVDKIVNKYQNDNSAFRDWLHKHSEEYINISGETSSESFD